MARAGGGRARFAATLRERGLDGEVTVRETPQSTRTAPEAAAAVGCEVAQIVKSLVFRGARSGAACLALVGGDVRADPARLERALGEPVERPDGDWVRERTGYAIGGVPPFGHREPLPTLIDRGLLAHAEVWAAAGSPHAVFPVAPARLVELTGGRVEDLADGG
jgi:prolyl-tRNA editing enzyme YbaK/EbsC (Cys-tRNA(Pro) deacylase)